MAYLFLGNMLHRDKFGYEDSYFLCEIYVKLETLGLWKQDSVGDSYFLYKMYGKLGTL